VAASDWAEFNELEPAAGRLLVATPLLGDPNFSRTVIYLLEHDGGGTVGVVLNRPSHTPVGQVLPDWHDAMSGPAVVFGGGPVQPDGALCLGELGPRSSGIREVVDGISTVDLDGDVAVIAPDAGRLRVFAGHSGWARDQLAGELAEGAWWVFAGSPDDLFSDDPKTMWRRVLARQPMPLRLFSTYPPDATVN
jgi:putative transcriptional regulator